MEKLRRVLTKSSARKVLSFSFYVLLLVIIITGIDLAITLTGVAITPPNDMVKQASWGLDDSGENIEFFIGFEIPNWGYLGKGAVFQIKMTVLDNPKLDKVTMKLGNEIDIKIKYNFSTEIQEALSSGALEFDLLIQIRPMFLGNVMESATRYVTYEGVVR